MAASHLVHTDTYNAHTLHWMDFSKIDGHWVKGGGADEEEEVRVERDYLHHVMSIAPIFILFLSLRLILQRQLGEILLSPSLCIDHDVHLSDLRMISCRLFQSRSLVSFLQPEVLLRRRATIWLLHQIRPWFLTSPW